MTKLLQHTELRLQPLELPFLEQEEYLGHGLPALLYGRAPLHLEQGQLQHVLAFPGAHGPAASLPPSAPEGPHRDEPLFPCAFPKWTASPSHDAHHLPHFPHLTLPPGSSSPSSFSGSPAQATTGIPATSPPIASTVICYATFA